MNRNRTENYVDGEITEAKLDATLQAKVNGVGLNHTHDYAATGHTHTLSQVTDAGDSAGLDVGTVAGTVAAGDHAHADLAPLASPTFTGTVTGTFSGNLTGNVTGTASGNLTSASTLDATKLSGNLPALNGSALTALNGTNISSGTVADGRLSANVPLLNAGNVFTARQQAEGLSLGTATSTYYAHIAPTAGATAGQTAFFQDATVTTGKTKVVVKAGAGDVASDVLLHIQNAAGADLFRVFQDGRAAVSGTVTTSISPISGSALSAYRNVADANPALTIQQTHASSTGHILDLKNNAAVKVYVTQGGTVVVDDAATGIVLKDAAATPHYWRITVSTAGVLGTTDLGTTAP